jgi:hypothetical protein
MITYKLTNDEKVLRTNTETGEVWIIPTNSRATWIGQEYQDWLAQGNEPEPADEE